MCETWAQRMSGCNHDQATGNYKQQCDNMQTCPGVRLIPYRKVAGYCDRCYPRVIAPAGGAPPPTGPLVGIAQAFYSPASERPSVPSAEPSVPGASSYVPSEPSRPQSPLFFSPIEGPSKLERMNVKSLNRHNREARVLQGDRDFTWQYRVVADTLKERKVLRLCSPVQVYVRRIWFVLREYFPHP